MSTEKSEIVFEAKNTQKEQWETPELSELDINDTESGLSLGAEYLVLSPIS